MNKVLAIGIDGGEFSVFYEMISRGVMPRLQAILKKSQSMELDCYVDGPGQGWASFMTGKSPRKHGFYYWKIFKGATNRDFNSDLLWDVIGAAGKTSGVVNMSYTFPPASIDGVMISGLGGGLSPTTKTGYSFPDDLLNELNEKIDGYIWGVDRTPGGINKQLNYMNMLIDMTKKRTSACKYLIETRDPDFFTVVYRGADAIQHNFWAFVDSSKSIPHKWEPLLKKINEYYFELDKSIGELWDEADGKYRMIISDHGFGPTDFVFYINEYLQSEGYLFKNKNLKAQIGNKFFLSLKSTLEPYKRQLNKFRILRFLNKARKRHLPKIEIAIDFSRTSLYAADFYGISFNSKRVAGGEREQLFEEIRDKLENIIDPFLGKPIFRQIYPKEQLKIEGHLDTAPDIIFELANEACLVSPDVDLSRDGKIFENTNDKLIWHTSGNHRRMGILISDSLSLSDDKRDVIKITDIYSTILNILGIDLPESVDGVPLPFERAK